MSNDTNMDNRILAELKWKFRIKWLMVCGKITDLYYSAVKWYNEVTKPATEAEYKGEGK